MAESIASYLKALEGDLRGRLPAAEVAAVLDESASHLYDLSHELGSEEKAVAKFGNPRRCARRILRDATPLPNPWRASIIPLSLFLGYLAFSILAPWQVISRLAEPVGVFGSGWALIQDTVLVLAIVSFGRSRQILLKPLAVFCVVSFVALVGMLYSFGVRVTIPSGEGVIVSRGPRGLEEVTTALGGEIADWQSKENQLRLGMSFYGEATGAKAVPESLMFYGSKLNPATIVARLTLDDRPTDWRTYLVPFLGNESIAVGGADSDFKATQESWRREGPAALARVQKEIGREKALLAAAPMALRQPIWMVLAGHFPKALSFAARCTLMLLYLNVVGYLVSAAFRRFLLPRRRFA